MKKFAFLFGLMVMLGFGVSCALAQEVLTHQSVGSILKKLKAEGYMAVKTVKLSSTGDEYQVVAMDNAGEITDLRINSYSGEITSLQKMESRISMQEVVDRVESVGYSGISSVESKDGHYEIIAIGPNGKQTKLRVDATTGQITKKLF